MAQSWSLSLPLPCTQALCTGALLPPGHLEDEHFPFETVLKQDLEDSVPVPAYNRGPTALC